MSLYGSQERTITYPPCSVGWVGGVSKKTAQFHMRAFALKRMTTQDRRNISIVLLGGSCFNSGFSCVD